MTSYFAGSTFFVASLLPVSTFSVNLRLPALPIQSLDASSVLLYGQSESVLHLASVPFTFTCTVGVLPSLIVLAVVVAAFTVAPLYGIYAS